MKGYGHEYKTHYHGGSDRRQPDVGNGIGGENLPEAVSVQGAGEYVNVCRVYALAAYALLNANINQIANRIDRKIETVEPKPEPVSPARRIRRRKQQNWVNGWR